MTSGRSRFRTWSGNRGQRLPSDSYPPRQPVHVIVCTRNHRPVFEDHRLAAVVFELVTAEPTTLAACLMPDHLHWLMRSDEVFSRAGQRFKSYSTRLSWRYSYSGKLWQRSVFDHAARRSEDLQKIGEYIVLNPVRAGLVEDWSDYPWSCLLLARL